VKGLLSDFIGADFEEAPEPAGIDDVPSVPDKASGDEIALTTVDGDGTSIIAIDPSAHDLKLPENPGMLVQDRHMQTMEVRIDPGLFPDRSRYLKICRNCSAVNLHTGLFCSQCGQALVLEAAVKGELGSGIQAHASAGLRYGIFGLLPILAFFAITAAPFAVAGGAISLSSMVEILTRSLSSIGNTIGQGVVMATVPLMLLIALPSFLFGRKAVTESQKAIHHLNLNFVLEKTGRRRAAWGNALGWFDTYAGITFLVLVVMASLMK